MKEWKIEILDELNKRVENASAIKFYDIAKIMGYNHIKRQDVEDIARAFLKINPSYKVIRFVKNAKRGADSTESLFVTLGFTEVDCKSEVEFEWYCNRKLQC